MGTQKQQEEDTENGIVKKSIRLLLIRHAESMNNQVYTDARRLFKVGTADHDARGWANYIGTHRKADPGLSDVGTEQAERLSQYLNTHLLHQASHPVNFVVSPMRRTLMTIVPTIKKLETRKGETKTSQRCNTMVNGFFFESEGCHLRGVPERGMSQKEISGLLKEYAGIEEAVFEGFDKEDENKGWYADGTGMESREQSEVRSAKFFLWLCDFLDTQLASNDYDIFDAGAPHPDEDNETIIDHDRLQPRRRKRRTVVLVGHGDFMSLLMKRIVAGFGHAVEMEGVPHRSAFVHFNTGITEVEYFGNGRLLIMNTNATPHLELDLKTGGSLKDGWSFLIPDNKKLGEEEVTVHFSDELEDHVREQADAMKHLYLRDPSSSNYPSKSRRMSTMKKLVLSARKNENENKSPSVLSVNSLAFDYDDGGDNVGEKTFVIRRGMQLIGCASFNEQTRTLTDVVVRQSCRRKGIGTALVNSVRNHMRESIKNADGNTDDVFMTAQPISQESFNFLDAMGFVQVESIKLGLGFSTMKCKL